MTRSRTSGNTPSQRQLRVGELIRRTLAEILQRGETGDPELESVSITVSEVRISPDLRHATAYVMPLGGGNAAGVIKALNRNRAVIRRIVTHDVNLRYSPEIGFSVDTSFEQADRTRALLESDAVRRDLEKE
ncbi:MAG TPA: 30S ribosome-binding factor RbfA [Paracoccaceae bacterium]|nr:30S ribosome-binding factor RbfA [Paracoccaceae bacterium]